CRHFPDLWQKQNKLDKAGIPEEAFYHLYEMNLDGTGLRRLTRGKYDDFDGRYLPDGNIVFLSTRRGRFIQCGRSSAEATNASEDLPDSFVRCGGNAYRPVSVHTLHAIDGDGGRMRTISPFESFEWNPSVAHDGRILYARWDYVDRHRMWHMGLWSTLPDGTGARAVFGNFTQGPYSVFEARSVPNSQKIIFTASAHHSHAGGSLVLLDPRRGVDGRTPMTRLTPEVAFPEIEDWSNTYYANPYPLSEEHYLVAWSPVRLWRHAFNSDGTPVPGPINSLGVYLFDVFGNLNLLYRDPEISSMCPMPIRPRQRPAAVASAVRWEDGPGEEGPEEGRMLLQDVYQGDLAGFERGSVRRLRIVGVPPKTDPRMNHPNLGVTQDDPGKFVLGTVPVEEDGSAYFRVPSGIPVFFQALDEEGMALQTMRSLTYVQPGQTYACIGCHDHRQTAPPGRRPLAATREPSRIRLGPEGSWPLDFGELVQPVLDRQCVRCHRPGVEGEGAKTNLAATAAYKTLLDFGGEQSLRSHVQTRYDARRSVAGACGATASPLMKLLDTGHYEVKLTAEDRQRLALWMDTYAQFSGSYSPEQADQLRELRTQLARLLTKTE
ncbi:MAG: HzsA-related protein, partial [Planctomycetota bacterium]